MSAPGPITRVTLTDAERAAYGCNCVSHPVSGPLHPCRWCQCDGLDPHVHSTPAAPGTDHSGEVEAVARAIYAVENEPPWLPAWDDAGEWTQDRHRDWARAALAARRPATEAEAAVERVRGLHAPDHTEPIACDYCGDPYPCPTVRALGVAADGGGWNRNPVGYRAPADGKP